MRPYILVVALVAQTKGNTLEAGIRRADLKKKDGFEDTPILGNTYYIYTYVQVHAYI